MELVQNLNKATEITFCNCFLGGGGDSFSPQRYLGPVSELPSSCCLLVELQVRVGLPKEILLTSKAMKHTSTFNGPEY